MPEPLHIPTGVQISASPRGIALHYAGDVVLQGPIGPRVASITTTDGSITLNGDHKVEEIRAERGSIFLNGSMQLGRVTSLGGSIALHGAISADAVSAPAGSVILSGEHRVKEVQSAEDLQVSGSLRATTLKGGLVVLKADHLEASAVEGALRVDLGEGDYKVEIIIAPHIEVSPESTGRINVIESNNELGPTNVKGRFRLAEYAEFTGIAANLFLQERGVRSLMQLGQPVAVAVRSVTEELPTQQVEADLADLVEVIPEPDDGLDPIEPAFVGPPLSLEADELQPLEASSTDLYELEADHLTEDLDEVIPVGEAEDDHDTHAGPAAISTRFTVGSPTYDVEETVDESVDRESLNTTLEKTLDESEDSEEQEEEEEEEGDDERLLLQIQIKEHVLRLSGLYRSDEPQGVARLRRYVSTGQFGNVQRELPEVFNAVLRMHLEKKQRPHHLVVPTFNRIHSLVKEL